MNVKTKHTLVSDLQYLKELESVSKITVGEYFQAESMFNERVNDFYDKYWTWKDKILFMFKKSRIGLTTRQIVELIGDYEPKLTENKRKIILIISGILQTCLKSGIIKREKNAIRKEFIYGLSDWFDEFDELLEKYK